MSIIEKFDTHRYDYYANSIPVGTLEALGLKYDR